MNEAIKAILGRIGSRTIRGTVPLHPASYSSNDYSHPLPLLPHIATVTDTSTCEEWQQRPSDTRELAVLWQVTDYRS